MKKKISSPRKKRKYLKIISFYCGLFAEFIVIFILFLNLYIPLKRRYKSKFGEIDLICLKRSILYFFEIKFRKKITDIGNIVSEYQRERIIKSAEYFMLENNLYDRKMQFDYIYLTLHYPFYIRIQNITIYR